MFDVKGSKLSLLPKIWEVLAVGMGATSKEFLAPCWITSYRNFSQS
jgi:hypothetical protein